MLVLDDDIPQAVLCLVKDTQQVKSDMPQKYHKALEVVLNDHTTLFRCQLSRTKLMLPNMSYRTTQNFDGGKY